MNEYDLEKMVDLLDLMYGYSVVESVEEVDVILFNICLICEKV